VRSPPKSAGGESEEKGWDGVDRQDGRTGDTTSPSRSSSNAKKRESAPAGGFRGFSSGLIGGNGAGRPQSISSGSSSSSGNSERKKCVSWKLPRNEASAVMMPPCHPPKPEDASKIEKELTLHFESLSTQDALPTVAPLRINKAGSPISSNTRSMTDSPSNKTPVSTGVPSQAPSGSRRQYGAPLPRRTEYVEPWQREPTRENHPKYTTTDSPEALPSPPPSGSEEDEAEAEILKGLGRRPLPKVGGPSGPRGPTPPQEQTPVRKNTTKYGAQAKPPPVIGIVRAPSPPPMVSAPRITVPKSNAAPTISFPDDPPRPPTNVAGAKSSPSVPTINFGGGSDGGRKIPSIPSISTPDAPSPAIRPSGRPLPHPRAATTSSVYSSIGGRARASCNLCRNPIEGRIVTAGSLRFHPECFRCDHCETPLEHVGFYPEPKEHRSKRLEKAGIEETTLTGNGTGVRFYCHLDFHELFSPRCKSCKTPIEGEVVMACGSTWHPGHFFCAECGDPFTAQSKFVEKDGYAWCVGCYTKRYSGRCKKCRRPVTETVVKALGGEWHEECFCCTVCTPPLLTLIPPTDTKGRKQECNSTFNDGRFFVRGTEGREVPVCVACEERRLKA